MSDNNKTYRIKANVGSSEESFINVKLDQDYDTFQILSLTLKGADTYRLHNADYGVIVGRVLANENFGVPNAKISVFIEADTDNMSLSELDLYPYTQTSTTNRNGIKYNLLPNEKITDCHQPVGTFPTKSYLLDNDDLIEIFDNYYVYTTRTNNAGDYMICGVPTGNHQLHMDLDLSDCGILSQRPRDFVYKGYTIEQFENPNMFKTGTTLSSLSQIFSQDQSVNVIPFWGNDEEGEEIGITRADIHISFTFEPTCVFIGSVVSDNASNGISKKCVPTNNMGAMDELTTGKGTIEMIRKTPGGNIEEFQVKGNQVIDGNGVWCYQIPMNLDYMMTDEYGNMVPTDDPSKGIPTRTRVRFRLSLEDFGENTDNYFRSKALIPNNPDISAHGNIDYNFGSETQDESFRDLFWNNVYTVKSYIPRFQKSKNWRNERFSGIKHCNIYGSNNPIPYNNIRVKLPLIFTIMCAILKNFIKLTFFLNRFIFKLAKRLAKTLGRWIANDKIKELISGFRYILIGEKLCEDLEGWYFAPGANTVLEPWGVDIVIGSDAHNQEDDIFLLQQTYDMLFDKEEKENITDNTSVDTQNEDEEESNSVCITTDIDYLLSCLEMQLAQQYKVIQFDFYNDWINGLIYLPRWKRIVKTKRHFWFITWKRKKAKVKGCMNAKGTGTAKTRYMVQQCALEYTGRNNEPYTNVVSDIGCNDSLIGKRIKNSKRYQKSGVSNMVFKSEVCHKATGMKRVPVFGKKNGVVTEILTSRNQNVYYLKPCEWGGENNNGTRVLLYATDLVLLGSLNDCDDNGIPQAFKHLESSSFKMPTNIALTTMDDDTFIYTDTGATICKRSKQQSLPSNEYEKGVKRQKTSYEGTNKAYSLNKPSEQITYENNDDPIAVTEAAGVCWNYTGPGQDVLQIKDTQMNFDPIDDIMDDLTKQKYLYYPGGHFLGLTCTNSKTNIKSCINLQRICELGTTMSERHEIVRGYSEEKNDFKYRYLVPTGFIAQDELNDVAFRTMFATMNHKKLIADKLDENTGYPIYGFKFMRPNGFDGAFSKFAYMDNTPYNHSVKAPNITDETNIFKRLFELNGWSEPEDYDEEETANTETRTIEDASVDYYMFRMGLNSLKIKDQMEHFLIQNGTARVSMPQYENSFYFYFGLRDGATALDEFKRQFFSECERRSLVTNAKIKHKEDVRFCDLEADVKLTIEGMVPEYFITIKNNKTNEPVVLDGKVMEEVSETHDILHYTLPIGVYTFTVEDTKGKIKNLTLDLAGSSFDLSGYRPVHFRTSDSAKIQDIINGNVSGGTLGGFLLFDTFMTIGGEEYVVGGQHSTTHDDFNPIRIYAKPKDGGSEIELTNKKPDWYVDAHCDRMEGDLPVQNKARLYGLEPNKEYEIYATLTCNGEEESRGKFLIDVVKLQTNETIDMFYGCYALSYKDTLSKLEGDWWDNFKDDTNLPFNINNKPSGVSEDEYKRMLHWALKTYMFRQYQNDNVSFDSNVFGYSKEGEKLLSVTFGNPERKNRGYEVLKDGFSSADDEQFTGYVLTDSESFYPTWGIDNAPDSAYRDSANGRMHFSKMVYTQDGRTPSDPLDITVTTATTDGKKVTLTFSGNGLKEGQGAIVVFEDGEIVFPFMLSENVGEYYGELPASTGSNWLSMAAVYPTFRFPVMYRPFFGTVKFLTIAWTQVYLPTVTDAGREPYLDYTYKPFFTGGELHNGITYKDHLSTNLGETSINDFALSGIYPDDVLAPDLSFKEYKAKPLSGQGWTDSDADASTANTTYQSGRTLYIKPYGSFDPRSFRENIFPGFPFYSQANTGTTFRYVFTDGYPEEIVNESNTTYSALTQPYFPNIATCSDFAETNFVDYIVFETNGDDSKAMRLLHGNIENTEYEYENGSFLRYYDISASDLSLAGYFSKRYDDDTGDSLGAGAWVYSNDETAKKTKPAAYVACFATGDTFIDAGGSNIQYVKVFEAKGTKRVDVEVPEVKDGEITKNTKKLGKFGQMTDDIIKGLVDNKDGKGINALYKMLTEDCDLVPLKNPSPLPGININGGSVSLDYTPIVNAAYESFLKANPGKKISLSNRKNFDGGVPTEVLGVCKHVEGRTETYVFKYYNCIYNFGNGISSSTSAGKESENNAESDVSKVSITGSTFNVTVDSDVEWILLIYSTTKENASITCQQNKIPVEVINESWVTDTSSYEQRHKYSETGIREIQHALNEDSEDWSPDAKLWDEAGGKHYPAGRYVFTVTLGENRTGQDLNLKITSVPYYPQDIMDSSTVEINQPTRKTISFTGNVYVTTTIYSDRLKVTVGYNFGQTGGEEWPSELTFTVNVVVSYDFKVTKNFNYSNTVDFGSVTTVTDVTMNDEGEITTDTDTVTLRDNISGGGSMSTNVHGAVPITFTISKSKLSGSVLAYDYAPYNSSNFSETISDAWANVSFNSATFNNLGDNYTGVLEGLTVGGNSVPTIKQPNEG